MPEQRHVGREVLPIPARRHEGLTTYDAKDPATSFPAIEPLRPPAGAPNVLVVLLDDVGFGASTAFGGPCRDADGGAAGGRRAEVQPVPHDGAVLADAPGVADGPQSSRGRDGRHHRDRDVGPRLQLGAPEHARRRWPRRSSSTATRRRSSASATRCRCGRRARWGHSMRGRLAAAGSSTSTGSSEPRRTSGRRRCTATRFRSSPTARREEGYHFTEDLTDRAIEWVGQQKALMPDKPFFIYFAPGAAHAPHHVPAGVAREVQGRLRRRVGRAARAHVRAPEGARGDPRRCRADRATGRDPGVGRDARGAQAGAGAPDGGLRRLPGARRPPPRPARRRARRAGDPRRHADLLRDRRQRRVRRGHRHRHVQRAALPQRRRRSGDDRVHGVADREVRHAGGLQPLRRRLGARDGHAVPVDQAGRLALGRHPQRHDRALAKRHPAPRARSAPSSIT